MFAIILKYKKPIEEVEAHTPAHRAYLDRYYEKGVFVMSGRQTPPTGGVVMAKAESREALEKILAEDPFWTEGVADYEIYEFKVNKHLPELQFLAGQ